MTVSFQVFFRIHTIFESSFQKFLSNFLAATGYPFFLMAIRFSTWLSFQTLSNFQFLLNFFHFLSFRAFSLRRKGPGIFFPLGLATLGLGKVYNVLVGESRRKRVSFFFPLALPKPWTLLRRSQISQNCTKQISKMTSSNDLISQNCHNKSKKWL